MKSLAVFFVCCLSFSAFAVEPLVGDKVVFKQTTNHPRKAKFTSWELSDMDRDLELYFFAVNSRYLNGVIESGVTSVDHRSIDELYFRTNSLTDYCELRNGEWDVIEVLAGKFVVCKVRHNRSITWWYSDLVPLGVVKTKEQVHGGAIVYELKSFRFGDDN